MKPTDEQLNDPRWWDENAPIDATHLAFHETGRTWFKANEDGTPMLWHMRFDEWREGFVYGSPVKMIPRPTAQPKDAPPWNGEGLPPVGCECECWDGEEWHLGQSVGPYLGGWLCMLTNNRERPFVGTELDFRPLRTPEQRLRDELEDLMKGNDFFVPSWIRGRLADAILAKYELKERE